MAVSQHQSSVDKETQAFVLDRYLADQTVTERLAFPDSATPPQAKAHDTAKWVDEWQAAWEKLATA